MRVLGIESSCDETAAAVVVDGRRIASNVVASQSSLHAATGGIVPEVASRQHVRWIVPVVREALNQAGLTPAAIDIVAATRGPGLVGSLLVGLSAAKALAWGWQRPFCPMNHIAGHVYANWLGEELPEFPLICLVVSGGHTDLVAMRGHHDFRLVGRSRDDAAGEAFDKVARLLGLGYPGGPAVERAARDWLGPVPRLPRAWLPGSRDFSFSGLKTAVSRMVQAPDAPPSAAIAMAFQESVVDVLVEKTLEAADELGARCVLLAGGVAANGRLRARMTDSCGLPLFIPAMALCTDNAAMIAAATSYARDFDDSLAADAEPGLDLTTRVN
ncbi:MAG: tRNA (adenosine(37)-N6)-threonylcarbamoyltransferase complex transferase subunit TsaD [Chloroflexota bacterium]|nr:MAG: tRNA (adenosine(37)-N6)-threonylcarbamoyltransferase complex transferase subunit TsaD [Chloroflexota bacterium]